MRRGAEEGDGLLRYYWETDTGEYPDEWREIADQVKTDAEWRCVRCEEPHNREGWHVLTVHHLDGDKRNCRWWNLAALCQRCHLYIQGRVTMDQVYLGTHSEWFRPYAAGYYAWAVLGQNLPRGQVEKRMTALLIRGQPWNAEAYRKEAEGGDSV